MSSPVATIAPPHFRHTPGMTRKSKGWEVGRPLNGWVAESSAPSLLGQNVGLPGLSRTAPHPHRQNCRIVVRTDFSSTCDVNGYAGDIEDRAYM